MTRRTNGTRLFAKILRCGVLAFLAARGLLPFESAVAEPAPQEFRFRAPISTQDYGTLVRPFLGITRLSYLRSAAPLGLPGFDAGVSVSGLMLGDEVRSIASDNLRGGDDLPKTLLVPRVTIQKGLPFDLDVAATVILPVAGNLMAIGGGVQWTLINGIAPIPSLALRAAHTQWVGIESTEAQVTQAEGIASFGLPPGIHVFVPYAGGGMMWTSAKSSGNWLNIETNEQAPLDVSFKEDQPYVLAGFQVAMLPGIWLTAEGQWGQSLRVSAAKLSLAF